jgi:hypothetical protein
MSGGNNSIVTKLTARIFPVMPDFYGMMVEHCDLVARAMDVFLAFMETGDVAKGQQVRAMEKEGDELKTRQMEVLNHAFATPMDREDIYRAIMAIDEILNYAKTTIREMEALDVQPDAHMVEIARLLRDGTHSLRDGYAKLSIKPMDGEVCAVFVGAPGRAHSLGGESPLLARQGEELAERQGCSGRLEIWRKPKAKRWPDEQEADTRRHGGVSRPISVKPETCTERRDVYPTGISVKVGAQYPGRSARVPRATSVLPTSRGVGKPMQKSAEVIVGVSTSRRAEH